MSQSKTPEDVVTAEAKQHALSLLGGDPVVMPASASYSAIQIPMSPGDAAELWEKARQLSAIYGVSPDHIMDQLKAIMEWDYRLKTPSTDEKLDSEGNVIQDPQLGLATTFQLLEELATRMEVTQNSIAGRELAQDCRTAMQNLSKGVLEYRTFDN